MEVVFEGQRPKLAEGTLVIPGAGPGPFRGREVRTRGGGGVLGEGEGFQPPP